MSTDDWTDYEPSEEDLAALEVWIAEAVSTGALEASQVVGGEGKVAALAYAKTRSAALLKRPLPNSSLPLDTVKELVRSQVADAIESGTSVGELHDALFDEFFGDEISGRALMIARTETSLAYNHGALEAYGTQGVELVEVADGDGCLPEGHEDGAAACDPDVIGVQEDVEANGQRWTQDDAGEYLISHPNCVRQLLPVLDFGANEEGE